MDMGAVVGGGGGTAGGDVDELDDVIVMSIGWALGEEGNLPVSIGFPNGPVTLMVRECEGKISSTNVIFS